MFRASLDLKLIFLDQQVIQLLLLLVVTSSLINVSMFKRRLPYNYTSKKIVKIIILYSRNNT